MTRWMPTLLARVRSARCSGLFVVRFLLALTALFVFFGRGPALGEGAVVASRVGRHVIVVSVDGLGASLYIEPGSTLKIPNLRRLMAEGAYAEGVEGVYPTVTYPSHTTLVTGRVPADHGIATNLSSREAGKNPRDWFWFASSIKVPTLWDEARQKHLSTASVSWPVTVGAPIDWDIPEIWDPQKGEVGDPLYVARYLNPAFAVEMLTDLGPPQPGATGDAGRVRLALYLLKKHKPNLMLLHLGDVDHVEHGHGPRSPEAAATIEKADELIGEIMRTVNELGLQDSTDVFVVSDHGFLPIDREVRPNFLLAKAGLLTLDEHGWVSGGKIATVSNGGSFFIYWSGPKDLRSEVEAALKPLWDQGLAWAVFDRQALREMGADPGAQMALEAPAGSYFSEVATEGLAYRQSRTGGTHGFLPYRKGLESTFIAWGPRIKSGVNLHRIPMTAIGPTILKDMGIDDPQFGSQPPLRDILK